MISHNGVPCPPGQARARWLGRPTSELLAINNRIYDLWERGIVYLQWRAIDDEDRDDPMTD
jgi:hypothetical protein